MVFSRATHNAAQRQDALHLKAVCSNPRHKREEFVAILQKLWLNESRLAPF
jgi:hypothetical protein